MLAHQEESHRQISAVTGQKVKRGMAGGGQDRRRGSEQPNERRCLVAPTFWFSTALNEQYDVSGLG
jgi:hypothetical protein